MVMFKIMLTPGRRQDVSVKVTCFFEPVFHSQKTFSPDRAQQLHEVLDTNTNIYTQTPQSKV